MTDQFQIYKKEITQYKPFVIRAEKILPILVRQAQAGEPITYGDLAQEAGLKSPRLGSVLGYIGENLIKLGKENNREIPPIQCLVVNKITRLPGEGIGWFITKEDFSKLTKSQQHEVVNRQLTRIYTFSDWDWVLDQFNLKSISKPKTEVKQLLAKAKEHQRGGESPMHKKFKEYIAQNPLVLGLTHLEEGITEYMLPSQDEIDVLFVDRDLKIGIEVKSKVSDTDDILRGLFQCVKYKYLLEAEQAVNGNPKNCRVILVLENSFPTELISCKNILGIEVMDKILIP